MIGEIAKQVIIQMTLQAVDRMLSANAEAADNVGLETRISRTYDGKGLSGGRVCEWCLERECDELPYEEAKAQGAFERHPGCGCVIVYDHGDGVVDIADVTYVLTIMANNGYETRADVNGDNIVDIADVTNILTIMASQEQ